MKFIKNINNAVASNVGIIVTLKYLSNFFENSWKASD